LDEYAYLLAADVEVVQLSKARQGLLKSIGVDLIGDILNVTKSGLLLASTGLGLLVVRAGSLPARAISGGSLLGTGLSGSSRSRRGGLRGTGRRGSSLRSGSSRSSSSRSSSSGGGGGGSGGGSGAILGGIGGPRLGNSGGSSNGLLLLDRSLLLSHRSGSGLRSQWLLLHCLLNGRNRNLLGGGTVGLGDNLDGLFGLAIGLLLKLLINLVGQGVIGHLSLLNDRGGLSNLGSLSNRSGLGILHNLIFLLDEIAEDIIKNVVAVGLLSQDESLDELARWLRLVGDLTDDGDQDVVKGSLGVNVQDADLALLEVELLNLVVDSLERTKQLVLYTKWRRVRRNETHLSTNGNGDRLSLGTEDQLGSARVEQVQLVRVAAHSGVVLLDEEPADLILGDVALVFGWGVGGRGGGLGRLEVGRSVHSSVGVVERVGVGVLRRVAAVERSLGHIGHDDRGVLALEWWWETGSK
jgi:hypothetical protein